jgi:hypothetical protein
LLQRRWAETEKQGVAALERAHEEAERILRQATEQASRINLHQEVEPVEDDLDHVTAQEALDRLELLLGEAKVEAEERTTAEAAEAGHDNDTGPSGVWETGAEPSEAAGAEVEVDFGGMESEEPRHDLPFNVPTEGQTGQ